MIRFLTAYIMRLWAGTVTAQVCDGQYDDADLLIEQAYSKYGTLYSGGSDYDSVGPTLEIYRLLSGLPDSGMATPRPWDAPFVDPGGEFTPEFVGETFLRALPRLHDPDFRRDTPDGSTDIEVLLNRLTVIGPYAGWWLTPDAPHLTDVEKTIAQYSVNEGLDWLLSIQAASVRPFQVSWHLQRHTMPRDMTAVLNHTAEQYAETENLSWLVAASVVQEGGIWHLPSEAQTALSDMETRRDALRLAVIDCTASPAEYVAHSIATYEHLRQNAYATVDMDGAMMMPLVLRRMAAVQLAKLNITQRGFYRGAVSRPDLEALADDPAFAPWHNVGRSFFAADMDALITIHAGAPLDPKTYRLLNLLSTDDLLTFANSRAADSEDQRILITAAYLRLFALGHDARAADLVDSLKRLWPDRADMISQHWDNPASLGVRLARIALSMPEPRTLVVPPTGDRGYSGAFENPAQADHGLQYWSNARRSRDLPISIRSGGFLTRDLSFWMTAVGSNPYAGYSAARRTFSRGIIGRDVMDGVTPPIPQTSNFYGNIGIAGFAAWDELSQLGPKTGLANRIGRELVQNARDQTDTFINRAFADKDLLSRELELVIRQGRRMIHGEMYGKPLGQVAFETLHGRFARTDAAARTPYWFICRERCEP